MMRQCEHRSCIEFSVVFALTCHCDYISKEKNSVSLNKFAWFAFHIFVSAYLTSPYLKYCFAT